MSAFIQGGGDVFGPIGAVSGNIPQFDGTSGKIIKDGKAAPAGTVVGTTDTQTLTSKTLTAPVINDPTGRVYRVLYSNAVDFPVSSTSDTQMYRYDIPAGLMSRDGDFIMVTSTCTGTSSAGTKTPSLRLSGVQFTSFGTTYTFGHWHCETRIVRVSATSQKIFPLWTFYSAQVPGTLNAYLDTNATVDLNAANFIQFLGKASDGSQVTGTLFQVEFYPAP